MIEHNAQAKRTDAKKLISLNGKGGAGDSFSNPWQGI